MPYFPGTNRPPTKISGLPSLLKSAIATQDLEDAIAGKPPLNLLKLPFPLLTYSLSCKDAASVFSLPPLTTYRSLSPSPSASKKAACISSQLLSASQGWEADLIKRPF